jgi:hypothetical protein
MEPNQFKRSILLLTCWAVLTAIAGTFPIGFAAGIYYEKEAHRCPPPKPCAGYTVISRDYVVWCTGDTIRYDWKKKIQTSK